MELNKLSFNGGLYLDDTKVEGVQSYELTDEVEGFATLKLELLVDADGLFKSNETAIERALRERDEKTVIPEKVLQEIKQMVQDEAKKIEV